MILLKVHVLNEWQFVLANFDNKFSYIKADKFRYIKL